MESRASKIKVLFLCTGNACRSQMAEGWTHFLKGDVIEAHSAGVAPSGVDRRAVQAMAEAGVDISSHTSKHVDPLEDMDPDYVVTLCSGARTACPVFPAKSRVLHFGFDDPPALAAGAKTEEEAMNHYRRVRDEIRRFVERFPEVLME